MSMDVEERAHLKKLRTEYLKRLRILELKQAQRGLDVPADIMIEIEEYREKISEIDFKLSEMHVSLVAGGSDGIHLTNEPYNSASVRIEIELLGEYDYLTEQKKNAIIMAIAAIADIPVEQIKAFKFLRGSIILQMDLPLIAAERLLELYITDDPILKELQIVGSIHFSRNEENSTRQEESIPNDNEMPEVIIEFKNQLEPHISELIRRTRMVVLLMLIFGVSGALLTQYMIPLISRLIFAVSPDGLSMYLPKSPYQEQIFALLFASWIGLPLFVDQLWRFFKPALLPLEIKQFRPITYRLIVLLLIMPLLTAVIAHIISLVKPVNITEIFVVWLSMRITIIVWSSIFWFICLKPLWNILATRARTNDIIISESNNLVLEIAPRTVPLHFRLAIFILLLIILLLPAYLIGIFVSSIPIVTYALVIFLYALLHLNPTIVRKKLMYRSTVSVAE